MPTATRLRDLKPGDCFAFVKGEQHPGEYIVTDYENSGAEAVWIIGVYTGRLRGVFGNDEVQKVQLIIGERL